MKDQRITIKYITVGMLAVIFTWIIHEFAHWLTADMLGYDSIMRINGVSPIKGQNQTEWHKILISASGPIITILQGLIFFVVIKIRDWNKYLYPFLFTAFYMRLLAGLMNIINPNDEGRVSGFLELGIFTLPILITGFLFFLVYSISKSCKLNWKFQLWTTLIIMVASSVLILADQFYGIRIL